MKVYLPRWMGTFVPGLLLLVALVVSFVGQGPDGLGDAEWVAVMVLLAVVAGVVWYMSRGKLPAYVIEIEDDEEVPLGSAE